MSWLEEREEKGCRWRKPLSFYILSSAQARPIFSPAAPVPLGTRRHRIERGPGRTPPPPPLYSARGTKFSRRVPGMKPLLLSVHFTGAKLLCS